MVFPRVSLVLLTTVFQATKASIKGVAIKQNLITPWGAGGGGHMCHKLVALAVEGGLGDCEPRNDTDGGRNP